MRSTHRTLVAAALMLLLAACSTTPPPAQVPAAVAPGWQAPLPHGGSVEDLARWWARVDDPLLVELIESAQAVSPGMAQARSRIAQARATQVASRAALGPSLDGQASASRGFNEQVRSTATTAQVGLQATWELDLFGGNAATQTAADERLAGAQAQWHEARVSVAAEVALQVSSLRSCLQQLDVAVRDARSREETSRLSGLSERAGFAAPATAALARASAAEAAARVSQQRTQCDVETKALVALTGWDEPRLRTRLATLPAMAAPDAIFSIAALPAQVLAQRPDVYSAEREVAAASAEVGSAQAQRYPRLALSGSVGAGWVRTGGVTSDLSTWTIGPLALSVPILDGGRRAAQVDAAQARYEEAAALYRARVRQAVAEVEQALVRLQGTAERSASARTAAEGYRASFNATEARWRGGLASMVELEDARRTALAAENALVALQHERMAAWVALYRAAGGGWTE
ncbi:efflux transporter outer membrane subunit [Acidovorax sp. RAC01]|uniref:efflux transporter outer membrane subunit n=1 Tax=Acidovorax sp. RAC01 TaxID=1842533 RepID=UPI00083E7A53|nr:efflux transporter outer membrane subunit [Acidovorax sp. RAC01]